MELNVPREGPADVRDPQEELGLGDVLQGHEVDPLPIPLKEERGEGPEIRLGLLGLDGVRRRGAVGGFGGVTPEQEGRHIVRRIRRLDGAPQRTEGVHTHVRDDEPVHAGQCRLHLRRRQDQLELQEGGLLDDVPGLLLIRDPGQLDDEALRARLLDEGLFNPEFVDPRSDHPLHAIDGIRPGLGRHRPQGVVHLQDQMHPALEVQAQLDGGLHAPRVLTAVAGLLIVLVQEPPGQSDQKGGGNEAAAHRLEHEPAFPRRLVKKARTALGSRPC